MVATIRGLRGTAGATRLQEASTEGDITMACAICRTGSLGGLERQHVYEAVSWGKLCRVKKRTLRGSLRRRYGCVAVDREGRAGAYPVTSNAKK